LHPSSNAWKKLVAGWNSRVVECLTTPSGDRDDQCRDGAQMPTIGEMLLRMYITGPEARVHRGAFSIGKTTNRRASTTHRWPSAARWLTLLKAKTGMHRLVRIQPVQRLKASGRRVRAIDVSPEIMTCRDLSSRIETFGEDVFRASGAGGQHVNKTSSASSDPHSNGIVVQCQNERST